MLLSHQWGSLIGVMFAAGKQGGFSIHLTPSAGKNQAPSSPIAVGYPETTVHVKDLLKAAWHHGNDLEIEDVPRRIRSMKECSRRPVAGAVGGAFLFPANCD
jgi:hypothetical protein